MDLMTSTSTAREAARRTDGKFGEQAKTETSKSLTTNDATAEAERLNLNPDQYDDYRTLLDDPDFRVKYLHNPFVKGQKIVIPAGTPFRSMHPSVNGPQRSKTTRTVTVHHVAPSYRAASGYDGAAARVTIPGSGGYWKDFEITEEMLTANDQPVEMIPRDYWNSDMPIEADFYDADTPANRTWRDHVANGGD